MLLAVIALLSACTTERPPLLTDEERAQQAAENYYEALFDNEYETFLDGRLYASEMPESYRKALLNNYKQYVAKAKTQHGGVAHLESSGAQMDTLLHVMQVYLILHYRDSVNEEIVVPMVDDDGEWKMK